MNAVHAVLPQMLERGSGHLVAAHAHRMGRYGQSAFIEGGTDMDLSSRADLGCGSEKTVYSVINFSAGCKEFFPVQMPPGCTSDSRGMNRGG